MDFWSSIFDTSDFPARWHCGRWTDFHGWLHILSDLAIWSAYFAIPCVLLYFVLRRQDLPFRKIFWLFGAFILLCGTTHLMEAAIFWWPAYRLAGLIKLSTAVVSWLTVFALVRVAPKALAMRSLEDLEREISARQSAEADLQRSNEMLERRVEERTSELAAANARLDALFQNVPIGLALFDTDLRYIDLNDRTAAFDGFSKQEHFGKTVGELLPELGEAVEAYLRQVRDSGESRTDVEVTGRTPSLPGEDRHWIASYFPVRDVRGSLLCIGAVALEITDRKRAEQRLAYQYNLNKAITDNATTAIFMTDDQSRCTFMNPAAEAMTGFDFRDVESGVLHDFIHHHRPDGRPYPMAECPIDRALPEKVDVRGHEDVFIRKSGEYFPVVCNARPIFVDGKPVGTVIEVTDLTEKRLAEAKLNESESRFLQLANAIPQLAWMAHADGHIDWYNDRWYEYTGTTFEEMEGWGWQRVHDPQVLPLVNERWQESLRTGKPFDMVFPLRGADGVFRPFLTRIVPFLDAQGKLHRWFGTNTDFGEQQRIQEELRELAARLSDADRRKDEFLATLAHELRNPLAPIRAGLEVMKLAKDDPATIEEIRHTMERQTKQLITLVDDLLDVSRITQGKLELRKCRVKLSDVLQSSVEASKPFIDDARHELTVVAAEDSIDLQADPHRLAQVVSNLLNNAAKYTPEGGHIWLKSERKGTEVEISVQDNGIGIPVEMQSRIFEMFAQIDRPMEKGYTGLGIGLTLVKSLVDMHDGVIEVRSAGTNQGSEFRVRLPILVDAPRNQQPLNQPPEKGTAKPRRKVLVVDDNKDAAGILSMIVKMLGNEVKIASDGEQAIQVAGEFLPDIVLMDIGMPKMNGYEAARQIRQQPWGQSMMLVALTGWGQEEDKQRTKEAGFDFHLVKPADPSELQRLLDSDRSSLPALDDLNH